MRVRRCLSKLVFEGQIGLLWGKYVIINLRLRRSISIIIPAYNEAKRLPGLPGQGAGILERRPVGVRRGRGGGRRLHATAPSDWSARDAGVRVLQNPGNRGKGYTRAARHARSQRRMGRCSPMPIFPRPSSEAGEALERRGTRTRAGRHRLARPGPLAGRRAPARAPRSDGPGLQPGDAPGHRPALQATRSAASSSSRPAPRREVFSPPAARRLRLRRRSAVHRQAARAIASVEVPVRWDNVEGTKVSLLLRLRRLPGPAESPPQRARRADTSSAV